MKTWYEKIYGTTAPVNKDAIEKKVESVPVTSEEKTDKFNINKNKYGEKRLIKAMEYIRSLKKKAS